MEDVQPDLTSYTTSIVSAYVTNNVIGADKLPDFIASVHAALLGASKQNGEAAPAEPRPAVPVKKSVTGDYIICLEDGKKFKSLKRHLRTHYDLSPEEYREKWGLQPNYPMVAPNYATARSNLAKNMGLGRRPGMAAPVKAAPKNDEDTAKPARRKAAKR